MVAAADNLCVAIIDDDESFCRSSGRMLRAAGFRSVLYLSAEAFLADPVPRHFDCLLVDIQLTGISGLELQRHLAAQGRRTPVIFITAHDDPVARAEAVKSGCMGFFRKTDDGARILELLNRIAPTPLNGGSGGTR